jgi:hypothetical protein
MKLFIAMVSLFHVVNSQGKYVYIYMFRTDVVRLNLDQGEAHNIIW